MRKNSNKKKAYVKLINLLDISQNKSKDGLRIVVIIFSIIVDTYYFITYLPKDKLEKTTRDNIKVLDQKSISFINIQLLISFFSFCFQTVRLDYIFMRKL